jgi:hypothetical protein
LAPCARIKVFCIILSSVSSLLHCECVMRWMTYSTFMSCPHNFPYCFKDSTSILYCSSKSNKC